MSNPFAEAKSCPHCGAALSVTWGPITDDGEVSEVAAPGECPACGEPYEFKVVGNGPNGTKMLRRWLDSEESE